MRFAVVAVAVLGGMLACGQLLGVGDYGTADGTGGHGGASGASASAAGASDGPTLCGGYAFEKDPSCGACMTANCCDELAACSGDDICRPWEGCVAGCGSDDWECHALCAEPLEHTNAAIADLLTCKTGRCPEQCTSPDGPVMWGGAECARCVHQDRQAATELGNEIAACPECLEQISCWLRNDLTFTPDPGKLSVCDGFWLAPAGSPMQEYQYIVGLACGVQCDMGRFLECPGNYAYPLATLQTARVSLWVADNAFMTLGIPHKGATVAACERCDWDCTRPIRTAVTNDDGNATIADLPLPSTDGFTGYFEVTTADGTEALFVPSYHIVKDTFLVIGVPGAPGAVVPEHETGLGLANVLLFDCLGSNVRNGAFQADSGRVLYTATSADGGRALGPTFGWVVDVPPGVLTVSGWKDDLLVAEEHIPVRADAITWMSLLPRTEFALSPTELSCPR